MSMDNIAQEKLGVSKICALHKWVKNVPALLQRNMLSHQVSVNLQMSEIVQIVTT
jgi:hypothetical protein